MAKASEKPTPKTELEEVLIIRTDDPAAIAKKIAGLNSVGEYSLDPRPSRSRHDVYFDTSDMSLKRQRMNLRTRKVDDSLWITLKQNPRKTPWGQCASRNRGFLVPAILT